jgi:hypothetical protein
MRWPRRQDLCDLFFRPSGGDGSGSSGRFRAAHARVLSGLCRLGGIGSDFLSRGVRRAVCQSTIRGHRPGKVCLRGPVAVWGPIRIMGCNLLRDSAGRHVVPRAVVEGGAHSSLINLELLHITLEGVVMVLRASLGAGSCSQASVSFRVVSNDASSLGTAQSALRLSPEPALWGTGGAALIPKFWFILASSRRQQLR